MRIAFAGYYGFENFGDDLFAIACKLASDRYWPKAQSHVITPTTSDLAPSESAVPRIFPGHLYNRSDILGFGCRFLSMSKSMLQNDMIVFGGGSVFSTTSRSGIRGLQELGSRLKITKFSAIGVSYGPFASAEDESKCEAFVRNFDYISTRDEASYNALLALDLPFEPVLSRDLAGVIPLFWKQDVVHQQKERIVGIAPCNSASSNEWQADVLFPEIIDFAENANATIRIFSLNGHPTFGDKALSNRLAEMLAQRKIEHEIISSEFGPARIWEYISQCNLMLSVRLHGSVSAYLCRVPLVVIEYHKKCADFADDVGLSLRSRLKTNVSTHAEVIKAIEFASETAAEWRISQEQYTQEALLNFTSAPWASPRMIADTEEIA